MEPLFTTETIHDLSVHQEFKKSFLYASRARHIFHILGCFLTLWYISLFQNQRILFLYLGLVLFLLITQLVIQILSHRINYHQQSHFLHRVSTSS